MVIIHDLTFIRPWNDLKWPFDTGISSIWPRIWLLRRIWGRNICITRVLRQVFQIWPFDDLWMTSNDLEMHFFEFYTKNAIDWCVYHIGYSVCCLFLVFLTSWSSYAVISKTVGPQVLYTSKIDSTGSKYPRLPSVAEKKLGLNQDFSEGPLDNNLRRAPFDRIWPLCQNITEYSTFTMKILSYHFGSRVIILVPSPYIYINIVRYW